MSPQLVHSATEKEVSRRARQDAALVQAALAGQAKAYEALWEHYRKPVFYLVVKLVRDAATAEDLVMETFAKAFRHLSTYTDAFAFSTWLFRIATNASIDSLRRKRRSVLSLTLPAPGELHQQEGWLELAAKDPRPDPLEACIQQQRQQWLRQAVARLPSKYAALVQLRYFDERSLAEIATELELPLGTVKAFLHKSRALLAELLKDSEPY